MGGIEGATAALSLVLKVGHHDVGFVYFEAILEGTGVDGHKVIINPIGVGKGELDSDHCGVSSGLPLPLRWRIR